MISDAALNAWYASRSATGHEEIPLSVVAGLALVCQPDSAGHGGEVILQLQTNELAEFLRGVWASFIGKRPDLAPRAGLLAMWLFQDPAVDALEAARDVAHAAVSAGILLPAAGLTTREVDLFGVLWQQMANRRSRKATGDFPTPTDAADCMTRMLLTSHDLPRPGDRLLDPAVGTGGLFRAFSEALREHQIDPATLWWYGIDPEPLVLALCAINAHLWGLGPNVVLAQGNALRSDDLEAALSERKAALNVARTARELREVRAMVQSLGIIAPLSETWLSVHTPEEGSDTTNSV